MQRLGKNAGKYLGEVIDIRDVLARIQAAAHQHGWNEEIFHETADFKWLALRRKPRSTAHSRRVYISTGIHGDEPAGPLAVLQLMRENHWPRNAEITICPCLNPTGFIKNTRENINGLDLNRQYLNTEADETRAHIAWLEKQPSFDVTLCLHEDWESAGFYVYELNPDNQQSFAQIIVQRVRRVCPIDLSPMIEGREASGGIIRPSHDPRSRPQWPEAFYLITYKTRLSYTLESPSDYPLKTRVEAEVSAVRAALDEIAKQHD